MTSAYKTVSITLALVLGALQGVSAAERVRVGVPEGREWNSSFTELGKQRGFFAEQDLDVAVIPVADEAALEKKLIAGDADIGVAADFPEILAAWVKGAPIKIISPEATGAPDVFWFAKIAGPITSMRDLHGQPVGYAGPGSLSHFVLHSLLSEAGVTDARFIPVDPAEIGIPLVLGAQLFASWGGPAAAAKDLIAGEIRLVGRGNDSPQVANETTRVNVANADFLARHRDTAVRFLRAYSNAVAWAYSDPSAPAAYAKLSDQPLETVKYIVREFASRNSNQPREIKGEDGLVAQASALKLIPHLLSHDELQAAYDLIPKNGS